jgi:hypothetical protein
MKDKGVPFISLAMWVSVMLATALLALRYFFEFPKTSLAASRMRWRPEIEEGPQIKAQHGRPSSGFGGRRLARCNYAVHTPALEQQRRQAD